MKFSNSLKFNAVADWWEEYIAYSSLKKQIYQLEKQQHDGDTGFDLESSAERATLLPGSASHTDRVFVPLLDQELEKVVAFYQTQEKEALREVEELVVAAAQKEEAGPYAVEPRYVDDDDDDDDDDDEPGLSNSGTMRRHRSASHRRSISSRDSAEIAAGQHSIQQLTSGEDGAKAHSRRRSLSFQISPTRQRTRPLSAIFGRNSSVNPDDPMDGDTIWTAQTTYAWDTRTLFKRRITTLYISLTSLKSYVELNHSGFRKILKKYDKVTASELKDRYMSETVDTAPPFQPDAKERLVDAINRLTDLYAKCVTQGDHVEAEKHLNAHRREHIVWERDTVWRQMIGRERRGEEDDGQPKSLGLGPVSKTPSRSFFTIRTGAGNLRLTGKKLCMLIALAIFFTLLNFQIVEGEEANHCFAILMFCTILWATEAIPLFVTSLMVPLLVVCLRVVRKQVSEDEYVRLSTKDATKFIFSVMFSPTIMLLIGGFTIASALSKTNIDRVLVTRVLSFAGTKPRNVLLAFMAVSCFASMWISNVAAPTLCFTLIKPILRTLPPKSPFAPCLIIAIALAANIGGQSSPISSPQNLIAMLYMDPPLSWPQWFGVALPVSIISILLIWGLLLASYQPETSLDGSALEIKTIRPPKDTFTLKQYWVSFVCIVTIALWCIESSIEQYVGDMGILAIIPIVAFFSTNVLKKEDFEQFLWTIVFLAMGGIALGKAVDSSGLLTTMDIIIRDLVEGLSLYIVVLVLSGVVVVISTFISHTIAAVLLVPIALEVGTNMADPHPRLLIFITGLICSTGMGMPVSGFPNQTAANQEDEMGQLYLTNVDFLKNGVPASVIATLVVSTVGYLLMRVIGL